MFKRNIVLKSLLQEGLSEPDFYNDLVYKFRKIVDKADFLEQFKKIVTQFKKMSCNMNILWQTE